MIRIHCLVENSVKFGTHFWGEHGLCLYVETPNLCFFVDAGASAEVLKHNLEIARLDFEKVNTVLLSHGHFDHTTGLPYLLSRMKLPALYAHPDVFGEHYAYSNEKFRYIGMQFARNEIEGECRLVLSREPVQIAEGIYFSGQIPGKRRERTKFYLKEGDNFVPDPIQDDCAVYMTTEKGTAVIFGCGHAGVLNTLEHAKKITGQKLYAIIGGTHLVDASKEEIMKVVEYLRAEEIKVLRLAHCTGKDAEYILKNEFGERFELMPAGAILSL